MADDRSTDERIGSIEYRLEKVEEHNKKIDEDLSSIRDGQERSDRKIDELNNSFKAKFSEVSDSNKMLREILTSVHKEMVEGNKRAEIREDAARQRDFDAKEREIERKYEADKRADEIKKVQWKHIATALGTGGVGYLIVQKLFELLVG